MSRIRAIVDFTKAVVADFSSDDCAMMAAALAYYTVFSLAPMLLIVAWLAGMVLTPEQAGVAIDDQFNGLVGAQGADQVKAMLESAQADTTHGFFAKVVSLVAVGLGATGVMIQLQASLNRAWGVKPHPNQGIQGFLLKRVLSFAMILGIAFLLLVSLVMSAFASAVATQAVAVLPGQWSGPALGVVDLGVSFVVITLLFGAIYKVLPDAQIRWRDVAVGAASTAFLFTIGKMLIGLYLGNSAVASSYGAASSLAVLFIWVYYSSLILLLGAEFTQVWTTRYGLGFRPERGAVLVEHTERIIEDPEPPPAGAPAASPA